MKEQGTDEISHNLSAKLIAGSITVLKMSYKTVLHPVILTNRLAEPALQEYYH